MNAKDHPGDIVEDCRRILNAFSACPSSDELVSFLEKELDADKARSIELHMSNCPQCAAVIERLGEDEGLGWIDDEYRTQRAEDRDAIARDLGFGRKSLFKTLSEKLAWLWRPNTPLLVPAAMTALILVLWLVPQDPSVIAMEAQSVLVIPEPTRGDGIESHDLDARLGTSYAMEHNYAAPGCEKGESFRCVIRDPRGKKYDWPSTTNGYWIRINPVAFMKSGDYTVNIYCEKDGALLITETIRVSADVDPPMLRDTDTPPDVEPKVSAPDPTSADNALSSETNPPVEE